MIWTIAVREVLTRGRSKGFLIITGVLFVALIAAAIAVSFLGGDDEAREVDIGVSGQAVALTAALAAGDDDLDPAVTTVDDGRTALENEEIDVWFDGATLTWSGSPDRGLEDYIGRVVQQAAIAERAANAGLSPAELGSLFEPIELEESRLDGGEEESDVRFAAAAVSAIATFMLLQVWGSFMMMGVIEEKSSKVIDVLLSQVRPATLLAGKILGLGILAFAQMAIVAVGLLLGLLLTQDIEVPGEVWAAVPLLLITFVLGFGFYATAFAAVGSMVSRQEDATSAQLPAMLPLVAAYIIAVASFGSPGNLALTIGSFVPFTSPVLLPIRNATGEMPAWQVVVALAILAASIVVMLQLAGRIYRYSLLRIGGRVSWREAWDNRKAVEL